MCGFQICSALVEYKIWLMSVIESRIATLKRKIQKLNQIDVSLQFTREELQRRRKTFNQDFLVLPPPSPVERKPQDPSQSPSLPPPSTAPLTSNIAFPLNTDFYQNTVFAQTNPTQPANKPLNAQSTPANLQVASEMAAQQQPQKKGNFEPSPVAVQADKKSKNPFLKLFPVQHNDNDEQSVKLKLQPRQPQDQPAPQNKWNNPFQLLKKPFDKTLAENKKPLFQVQTPKLQSSKSQEQVPQTHSLSDTQKEPSKGPILVLPSQVHQKLKLAVTAPSTTSTTFQQPAGFQKGYSFLAPIRKTGSNPQAEQNLTVPATQKPSTIPVSTSLFPPVPSTSQQKKSNIFTPATWSNFMVQSNLGIHLTGPNVIPRSETGQSGKKIYSSVFPGALLAQSKTPPLLSFKPKNPVQVIQVIDEAEALPQKNTPADKQPENKNKTNIDEESKPDSEEPKQAITGEDNPQKQKEQPEPTPSLENIAKADSQDNKEIKEEVKIAQKAEEAKSPAFRPIEKPQEIQVPKLTQQPPTKPELKEIPKHVAPAEPVKGIQILGINGKPTIIPQSSPFAKFLSNNSLKGNLFPTNTAPPGPGLFGNTPQATGLFGNTSQTTGLFGNSSNTSGKDLTQTFLEKAQVGLFGAQSNSLFNQTTSFFNSTPSLFSAPGTGKASALDPKKDDEDQSGEEEDDGPLQAEENFNPQLSTGKYDYVQGEVLFREPINKFRKGKGEVLEHITVSLEKFASNSTYVFVRLANKVIGFSGQLLPKATQIRVLNNASKNIEISKILECGENAATHELCLLRLQFKDDQSGQRFKDEVQKIVKASE